MLVLNLVLMHSAFSNHNLFGTVPHCLRRVCLQFYTHIATGIAFNRFLQTVFKIPWNGASFIYARFGCCGCCYSCCGKEGQVTKEKQDVLCWKDELCPETTTRIVDLPLSDRWDFVRRQVAAKYWIWPQREETILTVLYGLTEINRDPVCLAVRKNMSLLTFFSQNY